MTIQHCPECHRGMMEEETTCPACGTAIIVSKAKQTWLKQMKVYALSIIAGIILLAITMPRLMNLPRDTNPDPIMIAMAIGGGLATLGGLFGLAVAVLFYYIWKGKTDKPAM